MDLNVLRLAYSVSLMSIQQHSCLLAHRASTGMKRIYQKDVPRRGVYKKKEEQCLNNRAVLLSLLLQYCPSFVEKTKQRCSRLWRAGAQSGSSTVGVDTRQRYGQLLCRC